MKNAVNNGAKLVLVDPRRTALADFAKIHLPLKVGSDIALLNGLMHVLIKEDLYAKEYVKTCTVGFEELKAAVESYPPERAEEISGVPAEQIREVARLLAANRPAMLIYTLGITEHTCGVNNVLSCANLQMLLGNVGFECGGVNPLRGQNNVQGACDMGALPNVYPGYQKVTDPAVKAKFEKAWGTELDDKLGLMIPAMMDGLPTGQVKAFYIFGENLANTEPDIRHVEHCLESAEFVVANDIFHTETTRFADVIFPATAWSEDDGTFTNSERRVNRVRKAVNPPGQAKPNWWMFKQIAKRMGHDWESNSGQEIWDNEISVLAPSRWRASSSRASSTTGCSGRCRTWTTWARPSCTRKAASPAAWATSRPWSGPRRPRWLTRSTPWCSAPGGGLYHYHTRTQTGRSGGLNDLLGEETADISVDDAARLGISQGQKVAVSSRRGRVEVTAKVTPEVPPGMVWMAFHFREGCANWLTNPVYDPVSQTAEYKACAVKIEPL